MGQPRNRLTMFLIALLIAVAAAQNNYTIITLYSDTTCTATARTAVYSFNTTAACTAKGCTNGYSISCSTTNATFADAGNDVCGYNAYTQGTSCPDGPISTALRFTTRTWKRLSVVASRRPAGRRETAPSAAPPTLSRSAPADASERDLTLEPLAPPI